MKGFAKILTIFLLLVLALLFYYLANTAVPLSEHLSKYYKESVGKAQPNIPQTLYPTKSSANNTRKPTAPDSLIDKANDLVLKYVSLPFDYGYGSGMIPLTIATLLSDGPILELGMGKFSTPLLHSIGADQARQVVSLETDMQWMNKFGAYNLTKYHKIYHHENFDFLANYHSNQTWGMVLVDHIYGKLRPLHIIKFANLSKIVVAHDSETRSESDYEYEHRNVSGHFKYRCKYSIFDSPQKNRYISTTILSNFVDLTALGNLFERIFTEYGHVACDDSMK